MHQDFDLEYIVKEKEYPQYPIILTHCLNYSLLREKFPNDLDIHFLIADYKKSICRKFVLRSTNKKIPDEQKFEYALDIIKTRHEYYQKYPLEYGDAKVIHIEKDESLFSTVIKQELSLYSSDYFERAWDKYYSRS